MKQVIRHEKYGEIVYEEGAFLGRKSVTVNGAPLTKVSKTEFRLDDNTPVIIKGNYLTGLTMLVNEDTIQVTPKIKWYEVALCLLPFLLIMIWGNTVALCKIVPVVGGAIGGAVSGLMSMLALYIMRLVKPIWLKIVIALAFTAVTFGICCGIGVALVEALSN